MKIFLVVLALMGSCQAQQHKKKLPPVAVYDQPSLSAVYREAAMNDELFQEFKRHPVFNLIQENASYEEGLVSLHLIEERFPSMLTNVEKLRVNDAIGSPRVYAYEGVGELFPTTLHYIALAGKIGDLRGKEVVQIGGGYGGLCCVLHQFNSFKSYTIVDTPPVLQLTKRYLEACGIDGVRFVAIEDVKENLVADVVLSDASFFECNKSVQDVLVAKILTHASSGFFWGRPLPKHYGVVAHGPKEVQKKLDKNGIGAFLETECNDKPLSCYNLSWKKTSFSAENGF